MVYWSCSEPGAAVSSACDSGTASASPNASATASCTSFRRGLTCACLAGVRSAGLSLAWVWPRLVMGDRPERVLGAMCPAQPKPRWEDQMPEDFFESEVALAAAATAVVFSPRVRGVLRQGFVYGVAGATVVARTVTDAAQTVGSAVAGAMPIGIGIRRRGRELRLPRPHRGQQGAEQRKLGAGLSRPSQYGWSRTRGPKARAQAPRDHAHGDGEEDENQSQLSVPRSSAAREGREGYEAG